MAITLTTIKESPDRECQQLASRLTISVGTAIAAAMFSPSAQANDWHVAPVVNVRGTYTDNVRLAARGAEEGDFVAEISPAVSISREGPGLRVSARYGLQYLAYANDSQGNRIAHQLSSLANAEVVKDLFFIDGNAAISQQNISVLGPQPADNISITDNRTTVRSYSISPYLRHRLGSILSGEARYTHTAVSTGTAGLSDSQTDGVQLTLGSGPAFRALGWSLRYSQQKNHLEDVDTVDSRSVSGSLRYLVTPRFSLNATAGYDKYDYESTRGRPEGRFHSVGFSWRPTERTSLSASVGRRFFGRTYTLQSSLRSRYTLWSVAYSEDITTAQSQFAVQATTSTSDFLNQLFASSIPDPALRQQFVDRFVLTTGLPPVLSRSVNYFSNQFFLQKSFQASAAVTGAKSTVVLSLFKTTREDQTALSASDALFGPFSQALDANTRQTGINALWNWRATALTSASLSAGYTRTKQVSTGDQQNLKLIKIGLATQIQPKLNGALDLRRQMQSSDVAAGNYVEHAITASLSMRF